MVHRMNVRTATAADGAAFLSLVRALADYERLEPPDEAACARLLEDAFGPAPRFQLWVASLKDEVVAYAATFLTYSTFRALPTLFLEDLFVRPDARRRGVGTAMLHRLRDEAVAQGCGRFEWSVLDWNEGAKAFYDDIGARQLEAWRLCRVDL
jgi:GNAT superfamily N-acetyltransferase